MAKPTTNLPLKDVPLVTDPIELMVVCTPPGGLVNGNKKPAKTSVTIRIDDDILAYYQEAAERSYHWKYQTMMNHALRMYMGILEGRKVKS